MAYMNLNVPVSQYGMSIGFDVAILRSLGANDEQISNYVEWAYVPVPSEHRALYLISVERGGQLCHVSTADKKHVKQLQTALKQGWDCLATR